MTDSDSQHSAMRQHPAGPRRDFWGRSEAVEDDPDDDSGTPAPQARSVSARNDRHEWVAHRILKDGAEHVCPVALAEHDETVIQSEPSEWVPRVSSIVDTERMCPQQFGVEGGPRRVNPVYGYIAYGGPLAPRSTEVLVETVETIIASLDRWVPEREVRAITRYVRREKERHNNQDDQRIVAEVLRHLDPRTTDQLPTAD